MPEPKNISELNRSQGADFSGHQRLAVWTDHWPRCQAAYDGAFSMMHHSPDVGPKKKARAPDWLSDGHNAMATVMICELPQPSELSHLPNPSDPSRQ